MNAPRTALAVALAIVVGSFAGAQEKKLPAKLDLSYIPAAAQSAAVLHPRALLTAPEVELLPVEVLSAQSVKSLGIDPLDVEQAVAFWNAKPDGGMVEYGLIVRFAKPYDRAKLLPDLLPLAKAEKLEGQPYWRLPAPLPSVLAAGERLLLVAPDDVMRTMLEAKAGGADSPFLRRMRLADVSHHLTVVASVEMVRDQWKAQLKELGELPKAFVELAQLLDHVTATETRIDVGLPLRHEMLLYARDARSLGETERLLKVGLAAGKEFLLAKQAEMTALLDKEDPVQQAAGKYTARLIKLLFDSIRLERRERELAISVHGLGEVSMVGTLTALLLPAVQAAREAGRRAQSSNNLRQLALAVHSYHDTRMHLPPQAVLDKDKKKKLLSWRVELLPYLDQQALYDRFKHDEPWDSEHNKKLIPLMPLVFANPNRAAGDYKTNYLAVVGKGTLFGSDRRETFGSVIDGTSNTIMFVEANLDQAVIWTQPDDLEVSEKSPMTGLGKVRPGAILVALVDGSTRAVPLAVKPEQLWAMFTMRGGEVVTEP